jgi:hypothetical protein
MNGQPLPLSFFGLRRRLDTVCRVSSLRQASELLRGFADTDRACGASAAFRAAFSLPEAYTVWMKPQPDANEMQLRLQYQQNPVTDEVSAITAVVSARSAKASAQR